jgi:hypothetical protein
MTTPTTADGRTICDRQTVTIPVAPPRDPAEYRATRHFSNRLRERVDERDRDQLPRTLIDRGRITRVAGDRDVPDVPDDEHGATVAFTTTGPRERPWTLVAALRPVAFIDDSERHRALTIFQGTPTPRSDVAGAGGDDDE